MSHEPMTAGAVQKKSKIYGLSMTAVMAAPTSTPRKRLAVSFSRICFIRFP